MLGAQMFDFSNLQINISAILLPLATLLFNLRQLYLVPINFFEYGLIINKNERVFEFRIVNKSYFNEEDVKIVLPCGFIYEIICATSKIVLDVNEIRIDRIVRTSEVTVLLLVRGESNFHNSSIKLSSKKKSGKILDRSRSVPANFGLIAIVMSAIVALFACTNFCYDRYLSAQRNHEKLLIEEFHALKEIGWHDYEIVRYVNSSLATCYSKLEIPVVIKSFHANSNDVSITILSKNKTSFPMKITLSNPVIKGNNSSRATPLEKINDIIVPPTMSVEHTFTFQFNSENPQSLTFNIFCTVDKEVYSMHHHLNFKQNNL